MEILEFIDNNLEELIIRIGLVCPGLNGVPLDNDNIEEWILNDEGLYNWALLEGVDI